MGAARAIRSACAASTSSARVGRTSFSPCSGLHAVGDVHFPCDHVMMAVQKGFLVDHAGIPLLHVTDEARALAELAGEELLSLADEPLLLNFTR